MFDYDIHTHSMASGHGSKNTIADMAKKASSIGINLLGVSDHGPKMAGSADESYFRSLKLAPRNRCGITVLYGIEANILDSEGSLDISDDILKDLDYCIASLHAKIFKPASMEENTSAYLKAMDNPYVKIIGHPDDGIYPVCYERLVKKVKEKGILIELNNASLYEHSYRINARENCKSILKLCEKYSQPIIFSSDSHGIKRIGSFSSCEELVEEINFPKELIISSSDELLKFIV